MAIFLPIATFGLLCYLYMRRGDTSRQAMLRSAVITATLLVAITEILSLPNLLTQRGLIVSWSILLSCVFVVFLKQSRKALVGAEGSSTRPLLHAPSSLTSVDLVFAGAIVFCLACIGGVALVAPPNSWDSMEHHLPRVIFWVSNHSVRAYPTPDFAQLLKGPGAEFISLHTYLLTGGDRFVNLVEFCSLLGCGLGASLVASKLGAGRTGQLITVLFVITVPEAILESSGSMTTTVASLWAVTACYFLVQAGKMSEEGDVVTAALATGLAWLTDPVSFHAVPAVLLACVLFRPIGSRVWLLKRLPVFLMLVFAVNAGQFTRAYQLTGKIFGAHFTEGGPRLEFTNARMTPTAIAANVLRQASLQMGTPSNNLNRHTEAALRRTIRIFGENPDDPGASWSGLPFYIDRPTRLETQAGNPVHFVLAVFCIGTAFFLKRKSKDGRVSWFCGGLIAGFIVFSALIRWQPWGSRFQLPLFVLSGAIVGLVVERTLRKRWLILIFAAFLLAVAFPYLVSNSVRSIVATKGFPTIFQPRAELYFGDQHEALAPAYLGMAQAIRARSCRRVAIDDYLPLPEPQIKMSPPAYYVYPLLAQLGIDGKESSVRYIGVNNSTARFGDATRGSTNSGTGDCAIICLTCRLSNGTKSDAGLGETQIFGDSELVFPHNSGH